MAPFIYVAYLTTRLHLPSNVYFSQIDNDGDGSADAPWVVLHNAVLYAGLELLSFVVLNAVVHWKFGFLPIIQLAFVLEHQLELVQSKVYCGASSCCSSSSSTLVSSLGFDIHSMGHAVRGSKKCSPTRVVSMCTLLGGAFSFRFAWLKKENAHE